MYWTLFLAGWVQPSARHPVFCQTYHVAYMLITKYVKIKYPSVLFVTLKMLTFYCQTVFQFVGLEAVVTAISDMYPSFFHVGHRRKILLLAICVVCFFIGLSMVTQVRRNYNISALFLQFIFTAAEWPQDISHTGWAVHLPVVWLLCLQWNDSTSVCHSPICVCQLDLWSVDERKSHGCFL